MSNIREIPENVTQLLLGLLIEALVSMPVAQLLLELSKQRSRLAYPKTPAKQL